MKTPKRYFWEKHPQIMCGFLCSSYFVCLSLTECLRIFSHFTVSTLPDFTTLCRVYYCVMPGNYTDTGSNTPRRAEPSIQFIRGIKSRDKPSSENLLLCYRQSLSGVLLLYVSIIGADIWVNGRSIYWSIYILYHDLVATVIIVLNQPVKKTRGHQRTLDCVSATSGELIAEKNICCLR